MHTTVIGLLGGAGCGKSTASAGLFAHLKNQDISVELVGEYAKEWAWKQWPITELDQLHIFGEQVQREARLYGKVKYIISDSPLMVQAFYEQKYSDCKVVQKAVLEFISWIKKKDVDHRHFFLPRLKKYVQAGRYETEEQARQIDVEMRAFMKKNEIVAPEISCPDSERIQHLYQEIVKLERPGSHPNSSN